MAFLATSKGPESQRGYTFFERCNLSVKATSLLNQRNKQQFELLAYFPLICIENQRYQIIYYHSKIPRQQS